MPEKTRQKATACAMSKYAVSPSTTDPVAVSPEYHSYSSRWLLLTSVSLLNVANYSHWISFASVRSRAAHFYRVSDSLVQLLISVSYSLAVPCCAGATVLLGRHQGLRNGLWVGAALTVIGGALCCVSTLPQVTRLKMMPETFPFWASFFGQALTGAGSPFIACVPTKVSQRWFSENQRPMATAVLGLSSSVGLVLGQALTPMIVNEPNDIPIMNVVWFIPAFIGSCLCFITVTSSRPPSPPSRSAALEASSAQERRNWCQLMKSLSTNVMYLLLVLVIGGAMGYVSALQIKHESVMCSLGYSNAFSGFSAALVFFGGIVGSIVIGFLFSCVSNAVRCAKLLCLPLAMVIASLIVVTTTPEVETLIAVLLFLLGFFAIGTYPTLLEFTVESTYPNDESVVTAVIIISSSIQGTAVLYVDDFMAKDITDPVRLQKETCTQSPEGLTEPLDHDGYVVFLHCFALVLLLVFVALFNIDFKRTEANRGGEADRGGGQHEADQ